MANARRKEFPLIPLAILIALVPVASVKAQEYDLPAEAPGSNYTVANAAEAFGARAEVSGAGLESVATVSGALVAAHVRGTYSLPTVKQSAAVLPTGLGVLTPIYGPVGYNKLPPTVMDSFVRNSGAAADLIYGDEGTDGPPPYSQFTRIHRIESGIYGDAAKGLTTGHRSNLPSAWGADEFLGAEWYNPPGLSTPAK